MSTPCHLCRVETIRRRATASAPFLHVAAGLVPVLLSGIEVEGCPSCRSERTGLRGVRSLHGAIAGALAHRPERLAGTQIRFLRDHAGIPAGRFAALLGIDAAHLSRVENGKVTALGTPADRLVRVLTAVKGGRRAVRQLMARLADAGKAGGGAAPGPLRFSWRRRGGWKPAP